MALASYAICTPDEVWSYLDPSADRRDSFTDLMETWVNGASYALEQLLNRPIVSRAYDVYQDGNGRKTLLSYYYPITAVTTIEVSTSDLLITYDIDPLRSALEVVIDMKDGHMTILPFANIGHWFKGKQNVHLVYTAGFLEPELSVFKDAVFELIAARWFGMGKDPRAQQINENVGSAFFSGRFNPKTLSYETQLAIAGFRRQEV